MIRKLISKVPIDKIIERDMRLQRSGHRYLRGVDHDSLVIDLERNLFYWNSIGVHGDALKWMTDIKGLSYKEALTQLQKYSGLPFTRILDFLEKPAPIYPKLLQTFFELGKRRRQYWYNRGISDTTLDFFQIGHTGKFHVIPIIVDDKLVNFQCRKAGLDKRMWRWSSGRPPYPFNTGRPYTSNYVLLTEGLPDAMILHQMGKPVISQDSGPQSWRKEWNKHIVGFDTVYIIFDNDEAGIKGARRTARKMLNKACIVFWPYGFPKKYDINQAYLDFGEEKFNILLNEVMIPFAIHSSDMPDMVSSIQVIRYGIRKVADEYGFRGV